MMDGVKVFLKTLGMLQYYDMFIAKGYDLESDIPHITADELQDVLMISCQQDRAAILAKARSFKPSSMHMVYEWLRGCSLDYYFISFVQSELTDLQRIAELELPNEDLYDELEIVLPGHRKRLERAVQKLKSEQIKTAKAEIPVTFGWWGKPKCLPQAKFDFLCVRAFLISSQDSKHCAAVDFMVDSGSDVSTVQESILDGLNLELIGPVYSCGVHGGNHCNLYRACLAVGDVKMEIEVMGSNYNSLGSRVVRHFRHVIDGQRHIWLTGNYQDPLPAILPMQTSLPTEVKTLPAPSPDKSQTVTNCLSTSHDTTYRSSATCENEKGLTSSRDNDNSVTNGDISSAVEVNQEVKPFSNAHNAVTLELASLNKGNVIKTRESHNVKEKLPSMDMNHLKFMTNDFHSPPKSKESNCAQTGGTDQLFCKDKRNNQGMSLSNVIPPHLRDTDDDVDHHKIPQWEDNSSIEANSFYTIQPFGTKKHSSSLLKNQSNEDNGAFCTNNSSSSKNGKILQHCPDLSKTDNISWEGSKSIPCTNNFLQASSEVVLLTLEDLDSPEEVGTGYKYNIQDPDSRCSEKRKNSQPVIEESVYSPIKRCKLNDS